MINLFKILTCFIIIIYGNFAHAGGVWDRIAKDKTIKIAVAKNLAMFSFANEQRQQDGFDVEVAKNIGSILGLSVQIVPVDPRDINEGYWGSKYDIAVASIISDAKLLKNFDIIEPYYYRPMMVVYNINNNKTKLSELARGAMGTVKGSYAEAFTRKNLDKIEIPYMPKYTYRITPSGFRELDSIDQAIKIMADKEQKDMETILIPSFDARAAIYKGAGLRMFPEPIYSEPVVVISEKGDVEVVKQIKTAITRLRDSGALAQISRKWFGEDISKPKELN